MSDLEELNSRLGIEGHLRFVSGPGGMPVAEINNELGQASIALQGAHVLDFQAKGGKPIIWMSDEAKYAPGKSLRGGVPICWPWFGPHASDSSRPGHGPARTVDWQPVFSKALKDGRTKLSFELVQSEKVRELCAHPLRVQLHITVGKSLLLSLETANLGETDYTLGEALHTYFMVGDVRQVKVEGLEGCTYIDKMDGGARKKQDGPVTIGAEADRIYLETPNCCEIVDPVMDRIIRICCEGSASVVVWNPWAETAAKMGDLGTDGYLRMLCVETANAADDVVQLPPAATHCMVAEYCSRPL
jgi:D-hexose-6-phosphate mutarotase